MFHVLAFECTNETKTGNEVIHDDISDSIRLIFQQTVQDAGWMIVKNNETPFEPLREKICLFHMQITKAQISLHSLPR